MSTVSENNQNININKKLWVNSFAFLHKVYSYSLIWNYDVLVLRFIHGFQLKHTPPTGS